MAEKTFHLRTREETGIGNKGVAAGKLYTQRSTSKKRED